MSGALFIETLRRNWRNALYWGLSLAAIAFATVVLVPNVEALQQMADLLKTFPPALLRALGGDDITFLATPAGYLSLNLFSYIILVFATYAVIVGANVTANEEEQGILDLMISLPLSRWRIVAERGAAYGLLVVFIAALTLLGLWIAVLVTPAMVTGPTALDLARVVDSGINLVPMTLLVLAITVLFTVVLRRRNTAYGTVAAFLTFSYFVDLLGRAAPGTVLDTLRVISVFSYYDGVGVMRYGLNWLGALGMLVVAALIFALAIGAFRRRDVGV